MKKSTFLITAFGILFLFFIQLSGTLVESIYLLDLLHSKLDEKVLGVLFFFAPLLLIPFYKKFPRGLLWITFGLMFLARGFLPYLEVSERMLVSGIGVFAVFSLLFLLFRALPDGEDRRQVGLWGAAGLGLAISLSVLLRTVYHGVEYSLVPAGAWTGWLLGLLLGGTLIAMKPEPPTAQPESKPAGLTSAVLGIFMVLTLVWFSFSAPAVIARWTQGNYTLIVAAVSLFSTGWVLLTLLAPGWPKRIERRLLLIWNILFSLALTATLLLQQVALPMSPDAAATVIAGPNTLQMLMLALTLLLFPVLFVDMQIFLNRFSEHLPTPRELAPGILLGSVLLALLVFANIFTNVWGYVPLGDFFRGKFWLSYFILAALITLCAWLAGKSTTTSPTQPNGFFHWGWGLGMGAVCLVTIFFALPGKLVQLPEGQRDSITVMTDNIQQANDVIGEKSLDRQLALIQEISPDILALQESDSARISLNNNDYVRFFADELGYDSYYGPTPVNGTFGTSILSKYPLEHVRTAYIYSDKDENANAEAEVTINGITFTIINVHPDGSPEVDMAFARTLIERSKDKPYVIAMGDYNLRDYEEAYQLIDSVYTNVWTSIYPSKISSDGTDMSGENRIDHIFISDDLQARNPHYILIPESATDHAVHWTQIIWFE
ncbi:MAG: endonuclease/exonuclease/phosphatase family protein [Anaerolineaceae bacterium]|nr:endonuclease/exonuclease/phosphatase family protein [Anaerolineaceae bacterium]